MKKYELKVIDQQAVNKGLEVSQCKTVQDFDTLDCLHEWAKRKSLRRQKDSNVFGFMYVDCNNGDCYMPW